jgi:DNA-binding IclR family transcriptional regulator
MLPRQKVNYHLRTLEAHGLVEPAGDRHRPGYRLLVRARRGRTSGSAARSSPTTARAPIRAAS